MMYLLDTNACIRLLNRDRSSLVAQRLAMVKPSQVRLCTVVTYELYYGAFKSQQQERNLGLLDRFCQQFMSLDFDPRAARLAGEIRAMLEGRGEPIGQNDLKIAAIAVVNGCTLVTHNVREFSRVRGLEWEDWEV
jgi:tRNA(fMet)-specific endonuclease VapC